MKAFISFLLLLMAYGTKAQIVNIPDANFKAFLISTGIDTNNDGEIQQTEASLVTVMLIDGTFGLPIADLTGIQSFTNLQRLTCSYLSLTTLDLSGLTNLKRVDCSNNAQLSVLNMNGCANLNSVFCQYCDLKNIDVSNHSNIDSIDLDNNQHLDTFNAENSSLRWLNLRSGSWSFNHTTSLVNLINCDNLTAVSLYSFSIDTLNISRSERISRLGLNSSFVNHLVANNCTALTTITSDGGSTAGIYESIDVTGCTNLVTLNTGEAAYLTYIDLSTCINLQHLAAVSTMPLYVNLKNGTPMTSCILYTYNGNGNTNPFQQLTVCADDFEMDSLNAWIRLVGTMLQPNINPYCSITPAGSYNTIKGNIKLDLNNNGCDEADRPMPNIPVRIRDSAGLVFISYTGLTGAYKHYFYKGNYTITPYFAYPYFTVNPGSATQRFDTANSISATKDFCIQADGAHNDLEITFLPVGAARPGFEATYTVVYKNRGTTTLSGNVQVNFDNNKMNFASASTNISAQSTGQLSWNYSNLQPFESRKIDVNFNLLPPPVNNIGDTITYLATITPNSNDETPFDNSFILPQRVRGAYDPNEKQCLEGGKIDISKIGDYLHYQIHFQNEGTDSAFNVVVTDTLSNKLEWNSFELINSSHPVSVSQKNGKLEFIFENIKLPYKAINEPASNGYMAFKIKPKNTDLAGDSLNNKAAIYFDFNLPVITNTATTIITSLSPVPVKLEYFSIAHKTSSNELYWKASCTFGNAKFDIERSDDGIHFTSIGNITASNIRCQLPLSFSDNQPTAGKNYYRLKITDADGISFYSKTLVVGNNKSGFEITAISNSIIYFNSSKLQSIQLKLLAADGKLIYSDSKTITAGSSQISLPLMKNITTGIYTLVVYTPDGDVATKKFLK